MEFNYNLNLINELLNIAKNRVTECKNLDIKRVKAYVSNTSLEKKEKKNSNLSSYKEKAKGKFENHAKDQEIKEIFEKIKGEIKKISGEGMKGWSSEGVKSVGVSVDVGVE